ncbi:MAG: putative toxin-antitoxin system toxin component, PIN family [Treponema sp.]|jgi:putative PIN family toxin of toxin-antitoxin system|nr:putative toxin-antitoxin system toxin component, PIN family [Treponema sp.]
MNIVIDTNIVASALFFGGKPLELIRLLLNKNIKAAASAAIILEYNSTIEHLLKRYNGNHIKVPLLQIVSAMKIIPETDNIHICRDPDDDKFISCAVDSNAQYIVSGDKDLLVLEKYSNIEIVTITQFFNRWNKKNES